MSDSRNTSVCASDQCLKCENLENRKILVNVPSVPKNKYPFDVRSQTRYPDTSILRSQNCFQDPTKSSSYCNPSPAEINPIRDDNFVYLDKIKYAEQNKINSVDKNISSKFSEQIQSNGVNKNIYDLENNLSDQNERILYFNLDFNRTSFHTDRLTSFRNLALDRRLSLFGNKSTKVINTTTQESSRFSNYLNQCISVRNQCASAWNQCASVRNQCVSVRNQYVSVRWLVVLALLSLLSLAAAEPRKPGLIIKKRPPCKIVHFGESIFFVIERIFFFTTAEANVSRDNRSPIEGSL